jgi:hypothetical protein
MPKKIPEEERETEDQMARRKLGPRGEPGAPDFRQDDATGRERTAEVRRF